jgi:hypothetical protein
VASDVGMTGFFLNSPIRSFLYIVSGKV